MTEGRPYLDPLNQALIDSLPDGPPLGELSVKQFRAFADSLGQHKQLPGVKRRSLVVPVEGGVPTWIYTPDGSSEDLPFIFYVHGGLWQGGSIKLFDSIITDLVLRTRYAVVFPEYSLSPEVTFPTIENECFAVLDWMTKNGTQEGLQRSNFAIVSDSAGSHISTGICFMWQDAKKRLPIKLIILLCPLLETSTTNKESKSEFRFFDGPFHTVGSKHKAIDRYIPETADRKTDIGNPSLITDKHATGFPPSLIIVASTDLLLTEGVDFGHKLQQAGRDCTIMVADGQVHDSMVFETTRASPTSKAVMSLIAATVVERLRSSGGDNEVMKKRKRARA